MERKPGSSKESSLKDDLVRVDIAEDSSGKFLLCAITSEDGKERVILRANDTDTRHHQILEKIQQEFPNAAVKPLGGGRIAYFGPDVGNEMEISEKSDDFGREKDRELTKRMLKDVFPNREIIIMPDEE